MNEIKENLDYIKTHHKEIYESYEEYGKKIHTLGGPLDEKTRWLIKVAISSVSEYQFALKTHIRKAMAAGCTQEEIEHAILMIAPSTGFPKMMEAVMVMRDVFSR